MKIQKLQIRLEASATIIFPAANVFGNGHSGLMKGILRSLTDNQRANIPGEEIICYL